MADPLAGVPGSPPPVVTSDKPGVKLGGGAIAAISGAVLLVIFMVQNTEDVTVEFLWWDFTWPLWLLILFSAAFGALIWLGLGVIRRHRRRAERRDDRRN